MTSRKGWRWGHVAVVALLAIAAAACGDSSDGPGGGSDSASDEGSTDATEPAGGGDWDEVLAAAEEEGTLSLYASGGVVDAMVGAFEEAFPEIDVEVLASPTTELSTRLDAEFQSGNVQADALYFALPAWVAEAGAAGRFAEPTGPAAEGFPEEAIVDNVVSVGGDPYGLFWNTDLVADAPDTVEWDSFVDPAYDGLVAFIEPVSPIIATLIGFQEQEHPGDAFYSEKIAGLNPQITASGSANHQAISAGEAAWTPHGISTFSKALIDEGAPVDFQVPEGPVFSITYTTMALKDAPHPNAALVFVDWLMSEEGQQVLVDNGQVVSYRAAGNPDFRPEGALDVTLDDIITAGPDDPDPDTASLVEGILADVRG
ncbi:MAG TPA: extracellular solute-binding protein [Acidimicrobiales bacterium]